MELTARLEKTFQRFAKYGEHVQSSMVTSSILLNRIARDSHLLIQLCDESFIEHFVEHSVLKKMVDAELVRMVLVFFVGWVNLETLPMPEAVSAAVPCVASSPCWGERLSNEVEDVCIVP